LPCSSFVTSKVCNKLTDYGIPVVRPIGGHAVYADTDRFFEGTETKDEDFKEQAFTALLFIAGHRVCELGLYAFGKCSDISRLYGAWAQTPSG